MSNTRYLEFDSTYRDRTRWPLPAEFEVQLSQTGTKGKIDALDPVSLATPILLYNGEFDQASNTFDITGGAVTSTVAAPVSELGNTTTPSVFIIEFPGGKLKTTNGFYDGAVMTITTASGIEHQRIDSYEFVNTSGGLDRGKFTFLTSFSSNVDDADVAVIANPSDNNATNAQIFIASGSGASNFYIGEFIEDTTIGETRTITAYDGVTHIATLDSPFGGGWAATDAYVIRKARPSETGTLVASTTTSFTLPATSSRIDGFYRGDFIRIIAGGAINEIRRIVSYDGATRAGTVTPPFSIAPGAVTYEILAFTRDNAVPFNYTGSDVSQQEMVCYEIELLNVVLPNRTLVVGKGSRITFYPYVYVEFSNVSAASAGTKGVIYSNNPNATRMLFRAAVDDVPNPLLSPFIKLDGDGMVQTVKFKVNDNLKFAVHLPDGDVFQTDQTETQSPEEPNPLMQVSVLFSLRRL
jgi:hypothetical protein